MTKHLILIVALAACKKDGGDVKGGPATAAGPDCAIVDGTIDGMIAKKQGSGAPLAPDRLARMEKLRGVLKTRCGEDKWSPEMLGCMTTVTAQPALMQCMSKHLAPEAQTKLQGEIMGAMTGGLVPPAGMPTHQ